MEPNYKGIQNKLKNIDKKINAINRSEHSFLKENLRQLLWYNFIIGLARGLGTAIGFTVLGALAIYFLQKLVLLNLPLISQWISDIIQLVQTYKQ